MAIAPQTTVRLLYVPLDPSNKNQIHFGSGLAQQTYFESKTKHVYYNCTYQRQNKTFRVGELIDNLYDCNYLMYMNGEKRFYAYITKMEFVNNTCTEITIETDVYQTWMFDVTLMDSYVVREHVSDDTIGANLVDEGLEFGEYIFDNVATISELNELWTVVGLSGNPLGGGAGALFNNVYHGLLFRAYANTTEGAGQLRAWIESINSSLVAIVFTVPKMFLPSGIVSGAYIADGTPAQYLNYTYNINRSTIDTYTPKNKKLLTYPYTALHVSNNKGLSVTLKIEDFSTENPQFKVGGLMAPNPVAYCTPLMHRHAIQDLENTVQLDGYPLCSWSNDLFNNWFAQNSSSVILNTALGVGGSIVGAATGNAIAVGGGIMSIVNQINNVYSRSKQPNQVSGNITNGSLNCAIGTQNFYFRQLQIKRDFAERLDQFFDMFGYKVNTVKTPNVTGRPYWNYVQTIDVNLKGDIPQDDLIKLKNMYNKGVTFWHSGDNVGNYSLNNH